MEFILLSAEAPHLFDFPEALLDPKLSILQSFPRIAACAVWASTVQLVERFPLDLSQGGFPLDFQYSWWGFPLNLSQGGFPLCVFFLEFHHSWWGFPLNLSQGGFPFFFFFLEFHHSWWGFPLNLSQGGFPLGVFFWNSINAGGGFL